MMKRLLVSLLIALGAVAFSAAPAFAAPVRATVEQKAKKETRTVTFKTSIHCQNCVKKLNDNVAFEKGVKDLKVSLDEKLVTITYNPSKTDEARLAKAIEKLGYTAQKTEPSR